MRLEAIDVTVPDNYRRRRDFYRLLPGVQDLYQRALPRINSGRIGKVIIQVGTAHDKKTSAANMEDILFASYPFDLKRFPKLAEAEQKRAILDFMHAGMLKMARFCRLKPTIFEAAYKHALDCQLVNEEAIGRPAINRLRYAAQLYRVFGTRFMEACVSIKDSTGKELKFVGVRRMKAWAGDEYPDEFLGKLKWMTEKRLAYTGKDGVRKMISVK